ncbi:MAG TPA: hypothetical protein VFF31_19030 [Blastocatellia bacterium]|nr:hypothetical protein [Blastocatellia bacterium]
MLKLRSFALTAILLIGVAVVPVLSQGTLQKRVNFTVNVPFELKKGEAVLPPGNYVLFQISQSDPQLFALFPEDLTHEPIAMIRTTRIDYSGNRYPRKTRLLMDTEESWPQKYPVLEGWNIPGDDGWEVISTVTRVKGINVRGR